MAERSDALDLEPGVFRSSDPRRIAKSLKRSAERSRRRKAGAFQSVERELLALERKYWQAIKDKDADAAMRLSDNPCIVTGAQGVALIDRDTLARMMTAASYTLHDFEIGDDVKYAGSATALPSLPTTCTRS